MRKRFEQQYSLGIIKIEDTEIDLQSRTAFTKLLLALKKLYTTPKYNDKIFRILEKVIVSPQKKKGNIKKQHFYQFGTLIVLFRTKKLNL